MSEGGLLGSGTLSPTIPHELFEAMPFQMVIVDH